MKAEAHLWSFDSRNSVLRKIPSVTDLTRK